MLSRRKFLYGASAGALLIGSPVLARRGGLVAVANSGLIRPTFGGNSNAVISTLSGNFTMSRTSGYVGVWPSANVGQTGINIPAFVQVSVNGLHGVGGISASGTITGANGVTIPARAFQDVEFTWNFGDSAGQEVFTHPVTGQSVNANNSQTGAVAAYAYRTVTSGGSQTYTITLTARYWTGSAYNTQTFTQTFTAADITTMSGYTREWYVDSVGGNDTTGTGTFAAPYASLTKLMGASFANKSMFWLKCGSTFSDAVTQNNLLNAGGRPCQFQRIGAYGTGAKPIISVANAHGNGSPINYSNGSGSLGAITPVQDIVWSNLNCQTVGGGTITGTAIISVVVNDIYNPANVMNNLYMDFVDASSTVPSHQLTAGTQAIGFECGTIAVPYQPFKSDSYGMGLWGCTSNVPTTWTGTTYSNWETGLFAETSRWGFTVGCSFVGAGGGLEQDNVHDHHIYTHVNNHLLHRWNNFGNGPNRNYCMNIEVDAEVSFDTSTSCSITGTISGASGTGPDTATLTVLTNLGPGVPTIGQFVGFMGGTGGQVGAWISGGSGTSWTIQSAQGLTNYATSQPFSLAPLHGSFLGTISGASGTGATLNVISGLTGSLNIGDYATINNGAGGFVQSGSGSTFTLYNEGGIANVASAALFYAVPCYAVPQAASSMLMNGNSLSGTLNGHSGNTSFNSGATMQIVDIVFEQNITQGMGLYANGSSTGCITGYCNQIYTARDNFWLNNGDGASSINFLFVNQSTAGNLNALTEFAIYRNKLYLPSSATGAGPHYSGFFYTGATPWTGTLPLQLTQNQIWDDRATPYAIMELVTAGANHDNSIIDNQTYYSPSGITTTSPPAWSNSGSPSTQDFTTWKANGSPVAFDLHSTINVAPSGWTDPPSSFATMGGFI